MKLRKKIEEWINNNSHRYSIPLCSKHRNEFDTEERRVHLSVLGRTIVQYELNGKVACILCEE